MNTSEVLNTAADLIEERGWTKAGGWFAENLPPDAPLCAQGALRLAARAATDTRAEWFHLYFEVLKPAVAAHVGEDIVFVWNDMPGRTAEEVIEALRATAVIEAARESAPDPAPTPPVSPQVVEIVRILHGQAAADALAVTA